MLQQSSPKKFIESELKRYGHTLGLKVTTLLDNSSTIKSTGNNTIISISILSELLDEYISTAKNTMSIAIIKAADLIRYEKSILSPPLSNISGIFYKLRVLAQKRATDVFKTHGVYIKSISARAGENRHAFYLAYNDKYVAISNRGYTSSFDSLGIHLYELMPDSFEKINKIDPKKIADQSVEDIESFLHGLTQGPAIKRFPFKPQKIGTCSLANSKSLIKPLLYLLGNSDEHIIHDYKSFTTWMRKYEIEQLIKKYLTAKQSSNNDLEKVYESLLLAYIKTNTLKQSLFKASIKRLSVFIEKSTKDTDRKDYRYHESTSVSILRRSINIAIIYKNLFNQPKFKEALKKISGSIEKKLKSRDFKDVVDFLIQTNTKVQTKSRVEIKTKRVNIIIFATSLFSKIVAVLVGFAVFSHLINLYILFFKTYAHRVLGTDTNTHISPITQVYEKFTMAIMPQDNVPTPTITKIYDVINAKIYAENQACWNCESQLDDTTTMKYKPLKPSWF